MTAHSTAWAIVGASLITACAGPVPDSNTEDAASELTVQYADATRGVRGTLTFDNAPFTGIASRSGPGYAGQLLDGRGDSIATWQADVTTGVVTGTIDGHPFTVTSEGIDADGSTLLQSPSGQALTALGNAASDLCSKAPAPDEEDALGLFTLATSSPPASTGTVSAAATGCHTKLWRKTSFLCDNPYWDCTFQTLCCFPTSGCRATYSTRCCR
jgi:hypothetical protein